MKLDIIGIVDSPYKEKFCIPRQSGICKSVKGIIDIVAPYNHREAFIGLEEFNYIWINFGFHQAARSNSKLSVRPPRLGGNIKIGVFATRSPFRPNSLGLSAVRLESIEYKKSSVKLHIAGHDFLDKTPVYDIRPYMPEADLIEDANSGWCEGFPFEVFSNKEIEFNAEVSETIKYLETMGEKDLKKQILEILHYDPRPAYIKEEVGEYGFKFKQFDIHFCIDSEQRIIILEIT